MILKRPDFCDKPKNKKERKLLFFLDSELLRVYNVCVQKGWSGAPGSPMKEWRMKS